MTARSICRRLRCRWFGVALACAACASAPAGAAPGACHAASGPRTTPLVELFTSEGCDSCPPADRWLSARFPAGSTFTPALALAFHVDYWDRLGWRDRFASAQFTQRQYDEMRANGETFVYTPQVLVQGHDLPDWKRGRIDGTIAAIAARPPRASIVLNLAAESDALQVRATAQLRDAAPRPLAALWLAYADSGHATDVAAGENRGARLLHDHVVRSLHGPFATDADGAAIASITIATPRETGKTPVIVAFVQDGGSGDILQSLALPACSPP
jgi:hypothetical protein